MHFDLLKALDKDTHTSFLNSLNKPAHFHIVSDPYSISSTVGYNRSTPLYLTVVYEEV